MPRVIRMGAGSIVAMVLFIPILILITVLLPVLIIAILSIAAAAGIASILLSRIKQGKNKESGKKPKGIIDVEYKVK